MALNQDDRVRIVAGKYKGRKGNYKWSTGTISAVVKIDGDTQNSRTLRRKSIVRLAPEEEEAEVEAICDRLNTLSVELQKETRELEKALKRREERENNNENNN